MSASVESRRGWQRDLTLRVKMVLLTAVVITALLAIFGVFALALNQVRVAGPLYDRIASSKDLVASVAPPSQYVVEAFVLTLQSSQEQNEQRRAELIARIRELSTAFDERAAHWATVVKDDAALRAALEKTSAEGRAFYDVLEKELFPAYADSDGFRAYKAIDLAKSAYDRNRAAAVELVKVASERTASYEARGTHDARAWLTGLLVTVVLMALAGVLLCRAFVGRVDRDISAVVGESRRLTDAVLDGRLDERGDAASLAPEFRPVVAGMNQTMDAFVEKLRTTATCLDAIARGNIPPAIEEEYRGQFDEMKNDLNRCIATVNELVRDTDALSRAAAEGRLTVRADASKHQGDFRRIVEGVNRTLDAVLAPIDEASGVLELLAKRDLKARVGGEHQGDHARIKDALNATAEALHDSLAQVTGAVSQVSSAASQIASSSQAVATGASQQAAALEETSASLESMLSLTHQAADHAQQANELARGAQKAATEGSAAMQQMSGAMGKIRASAEGTSQIIKDINEIAFQTNLLALNAAVEAARAGEAGRGFAVVAEEVRSLALRAKQAANKTEVLIRQSVSEASEGETTARHVNARLGEIARSVTQVSGIIGELSVTVKEQTAGIDQVTKAVAQMNQVTQQNATSSEQSSAAAALLSSQAEELAAMVGTFQT